MGTPPKIGVYFLSSWLLLLLGNNFLSITEEERMDVLCQQYWGLRKFLSSTVRLLLVVLEQQKKRKIKQKGSYHSLGGGKLETLITLITFCSRGKTNHFPSSSYKWSFLMHSPHENGSYSDLLFSIFFPGFSSLQLDLKILSLVLPTT